jgi:hypothetical protein
MDLHLYSVTSKDKGVFDFLSEFDESMPRDAGFTLLLPLHIQLLSSAVNLSIRDYPLPVLNIDPTTVKDTAALFFDSDVVIAEQLGPSSSVLWTECTVVKEDLDLPGVPPFVIAVPKTVMPVKIYSQSGVKISSAKPVDFTWGVSYMPAIQSIAKIIDNFTHAPPDPSPAIGFWDKVWAASFSVHQLITHVRVFFRFTL